MQIKTIEKVIINKMNEWLETITDENLRKETKDNLNLVRELSKSEVQSLDANVVLKEILSKKNKQKL